MIKEIQEYLKVLSDLQNQVKSQLDGLSQAAIDWRPISAEGELATNSLAVLAAHVAGTEIYWIKEVIGSQDIRRDRDAEFATKGADIQELKRRLDASLQIIEGALSPLAEAQLEEGRKWRDLTVSVRWSILHIIEHVSQHVGHMQLTRQLWKAAQ